MNTQRKNSTYAAIKTALMILAVLLLLSTACRRAPLLNVEEARYARGSISYSQMARAKRAILRAGAKEKWIMKPEAPGHIIGVKIVRSHKAAVDVFFNTDNYSIVYKESEDLNYTGTTIHRTYNLWVEELSNAIQKEIAAELRR